MATVVRLIDGRAVTVPDSDVDWLRRNGRLEEPKPADPPAPKRRKKTPSKKTAS
ncbi:MAG: hypothetical protein AAF791_02850 [Bacteroidota bacterium]